MRQKLRHSRAEYCVRLGMHRKIGFSLISADNSAAPKIPDSAKQAFLAISDEFLTSKSEFLSAEISFVSSIAETDWLYPINFSAIHGQWENSDESGYMLSIRKHRNNKSRRKTDAQRQSSRISAGFPMRIVITIILLLPLLLHPRLRLQLPAPDSRNSL